MEDVLLLSLLDAMPLQNLIYLNDIDLVESSELLNLDLAKIVENEYRKYNIIHMHHDKP